MLKKLLTIFFLLIFAVFLLAGTSLAGTIPTPDWVRTGGSLSNSSQFWDSIITDNSDLYVVGAKSVNGNAPNWLVQKWDRNGNNLWTISDPLPWQGTGCCSGSNFNGSSAMGVAVNGSGDSSKNGVYVVGTQSAPLASDLGQIKKNLLWRVERRGFDGSLIWYYPHDQDPNVVPPLPLNNNQNWATTVAVYPSSDPSKDGIYIAGYTNASVLSSRGDWRVERRKFNQNLDLACPPQGNSDQTSKPTAIAVAVDGSGVYIFGNSSILNLEKRNLSNLNIQWQRVIQNSGSSFSGGMDVDANNIYISYADTSGWHVEKRSLDGNTQFWKKDVAGITSNYPYDLKVRADGVYISGVQKVGSVYKWRIEKRDKNNGNTTGAGFWEDNSLTGYAYTVTADSNGVYFSGSASNAWRIEKRGGVSYVDCGLKVRDGSNTVSIACEPLGTITSSLRIRRSDNNTYGVVLVDPADSSASKLRIRTSSGTKALRKYP